MIQEAFDISGSEGVPVGVPSRCLSLVAVLAASWQARSTGGADGAVDAHLSLPSVSGGGTVVREEGDVSWTTSACSWAVGCLPYTLPR